MNAMIYNEAPKGRKDYPYLSVYKTTGRIAVSRLAYEKLGRPERVALLYDKDNPKNWFIRPAAENEGLRLHEPNLRKTTSYCFYNVVAARDMIRLLCGYAQERGIKVLVGNMNEEGMCPLLYRKGQKMQNI